MKHFKQETPEGNGRNGDGSWVLPGGHWVLPDGAISPADGSMVIPPETVSRAGDGDAAKGRSMLRRMIDASLSQVGMGIFDKKAPARPADVRRAGVADEPAIMRLLLLDVAENAASVAPPNDERMLSLIQTCTRTDNDRWPGFCGVVDGENGLVAVSILVPMQWWWSAQFFYQEIVNFVHPDHRRSKHVQSLLAWEAYAVDEMTKRFGYRVRLVNGVLGTKGVFAKIKLYRRFFTQVGAVFCYPAPVEGIRQ